MDAISAGRAPMGMPTSRTVRREPVGVVGAITPWNFPNQINLAKVGPALAAGNTVVLKPAPDTPWVAAELGRLAAERTDLPAGVLNVITARAHDAGATLATDPRVDLVRFTGSTATGRAVMAAAAPTLKRVFLELGGKSAAIVLDDARPRRGRGDRRVQRVHARRAGVRADDPADRPAQPLRRGRRDRRQHDAARRVRRTRPTRTRSAGR